MTDPIHIISLGAGVQSSYLHKEATNGLLKNKPAFSVFADTQQEPRSVYRWLEELRSNTSLPIITVTQGDLAEEALRTGTSKKTGKRWMKGLIPAYLLQEDSSKGLMGRKCTGDFKIVPIHRYLKKFLGVGKFKEWKARHVQALKELRDWEISAKDARQKNQSVPLKPEHAFQECQEDALAVQYIGITVDEIGRVKPSKVPWLKSEWPLIDAAMSRNDVISASCKLGFKAPRSACKFCPFHSDAEWMRLKLEEPEEFEAAVEFEKLLQECQRGQEALIGTPFLHESCKPLREAVFRDTPHAQQINLFNLECEGRCGV